MTRIRWLDVLIAPLTWPERAHASGHRGEVPPYSRALPIVGGAAGQLDILRPNPAIRLHELDHAGRPPATYADLFPAYLDALPSSIGPGDPVLPSSPP